MAGRLGDAIDAYRALVRSCGDIADEMVEKLVAMGMNNQASALIDMDRGTEAIPIYDDLIQRFDGTYNTELNTQVAMARYGRGVALGALGRNAEAVTAYDEAITRIDLRVYPSLERYVAMSLGNKGGRLAAMGRSAEALSTYEEVISRFRESKDRTIRWDVVAKAMVNSAGVLIDLKRYDEGLARCETLIGSSSSREPAPVPQLVAIAMRNKVTGLRGAGRIEDAKAAADRMLTEFGASTDKAIAEQAGAVRRIRAAL
jgi:tetratricopeptide (TPR) repeat protein